MLFIISALGQICLLEFLQVEEGVKFMKHFKGSGSKVYKFGNLGSRNTKMDDYK
jgi:hypothetical protein